MKNWCKIFFGRGFTIIFRTCTAGIVLGARVPIVLTSRADSIRSRLASTVVMALLADAQRRKDATT